MRDASRPTDPENNSRHWYPPDSELGPPPHPRNEVRTFLVQKMLPEKSQGTCLSLGVCVGEQSPAVNSLV